MNECMLGVGPWRLLEGRDGAEDRCGWVFREEVGGDSRKGCGFEEGLRCGDMFDMI